MLLVQATLLLVNARQGGTMQPQNKRQSADGIHRTDFKSRRQPQEVNTTPKHTLNTKRKPQDRPWQQMIATKQTSIVSNNLKHIIVHRSERMEERSTLKMTSLRKRAQCKWTPKQMESWNTWRHWKCERPSKWSLETLDVTENKCAENPRSVMSRSEVELLLQDAFTMKARLKFIAFQWSLEGSTFYLVIDIRVTLLGLRGHTFRKVPTHKRVGCVGHNGHTEKGGVNQCEGNLTPFHFLSHQH